MDMDMNVSQVLQVLKGAPRFDYPPELVFGLEEPMRRTRWLTYTNSESDYMLDKYVRDAGGWDDFASEVPPGYFAIGAPGFNNDETAPNPAPLYVAMSRSADTMVFMRLDCEFGAEAKGPAGGIDGYLDDMAVFVARMRDHDLSVEIVETEDYGRYRLFDTVGNGVEREVLLLNNPDRNKELNRLVAELGVRMARQKHSIAQFFASDPEFQDWQFGNPQGSVMVLGQKLMPDRAMIHSAGCPSMIEEQRSENSVMCASDMHHLLTWAEGKSLDRPALCSLCFTL